MSLVALTLLEMSHSIETIWNLSERYDLISEHENRENLRLDLSFSIKMLLSTRSKALEKLEFKELVIGVDEFDDLWMQVKVSSKTKLYFLCFYHMNLLNDHELIMNMKLKS